MSEYDIKPDETENEAAKIRQAQEEAEQRELKEAQQERRKLKNLGRSKSWCDSYC
jgi:hypothetical protein